MLGTERKRGEFDQAVGRKHYLTRQDVNNIRRNVKDNQVIRYQDDATSVSLAVGLVLR